MFKFVLCALLAVAVAEPGVVIPSLYSEAYLTAPITTITRQASSVINSPYLPAVHLIKKRQAPVISTYVAPSLSLGAPWATPYSPFINPLLPFAPIDYTAAHLIKKRSAALGAYIASPFGTVYGSPALVPTAPLVHSLLPSHFIKKRSAAWAPTAYVGAASTYLPAPISTYSTAVLPGAPYWSTYAAGLPFIKK